MLSLYSTVYAINVIITIEHKNSNCTFNVLVLHTKSELVLHTKSEHYFNYVTTCVSRLLAHTLQKNEYFHRNFRLWAYMYTL